MVDETGVPVDRKTQRATELATCLGEITRMLDQYDATFQVVEQIIYPNGVAVHTHQIQVIGK